MKIYSAVLAFFRKRGGKKKEYAFLVAATYSSEFTYNDVTSV